MSSKVDEMRADAQENACAQLETPWSDGHLRDALPVPSADSHKYSRGVLKVIAGSKRYPGAACLAARAGQLMGAGYTQLISCKTARYLAMQAYPSLVTRSVKDFDAAELVAQDKPRKQAACVGPGFEPSDKRSRALVVSVLTQATCPVLVDGGGLAALGGSQGKRALKRRRKRGSATVITPHVGEGKRLCDSLGIETADPAQMALDLSLATGAVVIMKAPVTYVSDGLRVIPMLEGTAALSKAGTGDVLAGMISALLAQGVDPVDAGVLGATLHARAGVEASHGLGVISVTPEDVLAYLPVAIQSLL